MSQLFKSISSLYISSWTVPIFKNACSQMWSEHVRFQWKWSEIMWRHYKKCKSKLNWILKSRMKLVAKNVPQSTYQLFYLVIAQVKPLQIDQLRKRRWQFFEQILPQFQRCQRSQQAEVCWQRCQRHVIQAEDCQVLQLAEGWRQTRNRIWAKISHLQSAKGTDTFWDVRYVWNRRKVC